MQYILDSLRFHRKVCFVLDLCWRKLYLEFQHFVGNSWQERKDQDDSNVTNRVHGCIRCRNRQKSIVESENACLVGCFNPFEKY